VDGSAATSVTVAGTTTVTPSERPHAERTTAVLRQVFPEVTRVATQAGPGTHRLSITLSPETLGQVKVTLVVRPGGVHVSLAAESGAAHAALSQGAPELHRLLEATGGDSRVVVRDPSASTTTTTDQRGGESRGQQPSYAASTGDGRDGQEDRGPGRDGRTPATGSPADPTSPRGARPGHRGAGPSGTPVHPGRLDRLM
jgi:flagellar hook-length control protein FliK